MNRIFHYFTSSYKEGSEILKKAKILSVIALLFIVSVFLALAAQLFTTRDPFYIILMILCVGICGFSLFSIRHGRFITASNIIICILLLLLVVAQLFVDYYSPSFLVRNAIVVLLIIGLIGEKRYQEIYSFAVVIVALLLLYIFRVLPDNNGRLSDKIIFDLFINFLFIAAAFVLLWIRLSITRQSLQQAQKEAEENKKRYERLEEILLKSKQRMEIGGRLVDLSNSMNQGIKGLKLTLENIQNGFSVLDAEFKSYEETSNKMVQYSIGVKESIVRQNQAIDESASAIKAIEKFVGSVADEAQDQKKSVDELNRLSNKLLLEMRQSEEAIHKVSDSSANIMDVLKVISEIADQTNLLAMNTAIEAAHAGEYGKGFTIVAGEIRALSNATTKNSEFITKGLKQNIDNISSATEMVKKTSEYFNELNRQIGILIQSIGAVTGSMENLASQNRLIKNAVNLLQEKTGGVNESIRNMEKLLQNNSESFRRVSDFYNSVEKDTEMQFQEFLGIFSGFLGELGKIDEIGKNNIADMETLYQELSALKAGK